MTQRSSPEESSRRRILAGAVLVAALVLAVVTRGGAVLESLRDFDSDEAVVGLMARGIVEREAWPVFYAGQGYLGALEAWSAAIAFATLGESATTLRLVPLLYSLAFLVALHRLLLRFLTPAAAALVLLWTALGTPFFDLWSVKARGGFAEILFIGTLFLLRFEATWRKRTPGTAELVVLGTLAGCGTFVNPLVGTLMVVPLLLLAARVFVECSPLLPKDRSVIADFAHFRRLPGGVRLFFRGLAIVGLLVLSFSAVLVLVGDEFLEQVFAAGFAEGTTLAVYALTLLGLLYIAEFALLSLLHGVDLRSVLTKPWQRSPALKMLAAIVVGHVAFSVAADLAVAALGGGGYGRPFRLAPVTHWPEQSLLVFGRILPAATWRLWGLSGPLTVGLLLWVAWRLLRQRWKSDLESPDRIPTVTFFGGTTLATMLVVVTSPYTIDVTAARYLLPLLVSLPATVYLLLQRVRLAPHFRGLALATITAGIAAGSMWGPASLLSRQHFRSTFPDLVGKLESRGSRGIVADYWTAYPLAFLSRNGIASAPADGIDRFPAVSAGIRAAGPDAYVFREGVTALEEFRRSPTAAGADHEVVDSVGNAPRYHVFFTPSRDSGP